MAIWTGLGMNYGHFDPHNPYDLDEVREDLTFLKGYLTKLRMAFPPFDSADMEHIKPIVELALGMGFYVIWGTTTGEANVGLARFQEFEDYCLEELLPWAQGLENPNLEISLGNEESLHTSGGGELTLADVISRLGILGTAGQAIYTYGQLSTTEVSTYISNWVSAGIGGLDRIGFNCYSLGPVSIKSQAESIVAGFGVRGYISEWGTPHGYQDYNSEEIWEQITYKQLTAMKASGLVDAYYFTYRDGSFGLITDGWALKTSTGNLRPMVSVLFGVRPWFSGYPNTAINRGATPDRGSTPARSATPDRPLF